MDNCPHCNIPLVLGQAIDPKYDGCSRIAPTTHILTSKEVKLIDCLKCPKCGYSDDGN